MDLVASIGDVLCIKRKFLFCQRINLYYCQYVINLCAHKDIIPGDFSRHYFVLLPLLMLTRALFGCQS